MEGFNVDIINAGKSSRMNVFIRVGRRHQKEVRARGTAGLRGLEHPTFLQ